MHDIYGHFARDVKSQLSDPDGAQRHGTREPLQWEAGYSTGDRGNRLAYRQPETSVSLATSSWRTLRRHCHIDPPRARLLKYRPVGTV
jgi:hypothetical protein